MRLAIGECLAELAPSDRVRDFGFGFAGDTFETAWRLAPVASDIDVSNFNVAGGCGSFATLNRYFAIGVEQIVLRTSAQPVLFQKEGRPCEAAVDPVTGVVDTTAAEGSFNAGVLASDLRNDVLPSGKRQGCRLAGHVARLKGALIPVDANLERHGAG